MGERDLAYKTLSEAFGGTRNTYTQTFSTASRTVANATAATLTDNSGGSGTPNGTIDEIADSATVLSTSDTYTDAAVITAIDAAVDAVVDDCANAIEELAAQVNKLIADQLADKKVITALIDDLQAYKFIL